MPNSVVPDIKFGASKVSSRSAITSTRLPSRICIRGKLIFLGLTLYTPLMSFRMQNAVIDVGVVQEWLL